MSHHPSSSGLLLFLFLPWLVGCGGGEIWILTDSLPAGRVGLDYQAALELDVDADDVTWLVEAGALPPGLTLGEESGVLSGVPSQGGDWVFSVSAERGRGFDVVDLSVHLPPVILMSGFEPFGGYDTNPSMEALWPLHEVLWEGWDLRAVELPVVWDVSWDLLLAEMEALNPSVVLATTVSDDAGSYLCNHIFYHLMVALEDPPAGLLASPEVAGFVHVPPAPYLGSFSVDDITVAHEAGLSAVLAWLESGLQARQVRADVHEAPRYGGRSP